MTNLTGDRIRRLRKAKGYTLDELARAAGSSKSYIWELENKNPPRPSAEKLAKIAEALDTTVDALIGTQLPSTDDQSPQDKVFFRKFSALPEPDKEKFRRMIDLWEDD